VRPILDEKPCHVRLEGTVERRHPSMVPVIDVDAEADQLGGLVELDSVVQCIISRIVKSMHIGRVFSCQKS
jgi:hypothetical protein